MAKRIIILERQDGERVRYQFVLWAAVPLARQDFYVDPSFESTYKDISQAELDLLRTGVGAEYVGSLQLDPGTSLSVTKTYLENAWQAFQDALNAEDKYDKYGTHWDGTTWTGAGA